MLWVWIVECLRKMWSVFQISVTVSLCWTTASQGWRSEPWPGWPQYLAAVPFFHLDLFLILALFSLRGWELLSKFIACVSFFPHISKDFLLYLNAKGYFPLLRRFIILFFIFCSEYVFDTSLVIRIEAWHCGKQKMFARVRFHIINGSCSLPCKQAPWIILQYAVENCGEPFTSKSAFLTANSVLSAITSRE